MRQNERARKWARVEEETLREASSCSEQGNQHVLYVT